MDNNTRSTFYISNLTNWEEFFLSILFLLFWNWITSTLVWWYITILEFIYHNF